MSKVNANKKLELIKAIRMQNQYNRQLFRARENFLYSDGSSFGTGVSHGELYGLEEAAKGMSETKDAPVASGFRIRLVIAMVLLLAFILCDIKQVNYEGETTETVFGRIVESTDFAELLGM